MKKNLTKMLLLLLILGSWHIQAFAAETNFTNQIQGYKGYIQEKVAKRARPYTVPYIFVAKTANPENPKPQTYQVTVFWNDGTVGNSNPYWLYEVTENNLKDQINQMIAQVVVDIRSTKPLGDESDALTEGIAASYDSGFNLTAGMGARVSAPGVGSYWIQLPRMKEGTNDTIDDVLGRPTRWGRIKLNWEGTLVGNSENPGKKIMVVSMEITVWEAQLEPIDGNYIMIKLVTAKPTWRFQEGEAMDASYLIPDRLDFDLVEFRGMYTWHEFAKAKPYILGGVAFGLRMLEERSFEWRTTYSGMVEFGLVLGEKFFWGIANARASGSGLFSGDFDNFNLNVGSRFGWHLSGNANLSIGVQWNLDQLLFGSKTDRMNLNGRDDIAGGFTFYVNFTGLLF